MTLAGSPMPQSGSPVDTGTSSASDVGVSPTAAQSGPAFVAAASDANQFQIKAAQLAITKSQRDDVRAYAKRVLAEAQTSQTSLLAALRNNERTIKTPATALSSVRTAQLKLLQEAPRGGFDNLYLTQAKQVQKTAWSAYKDYAEDGTDLALKQVASTAMPTIEQELGSGKALIPAALAGG